MFSVASFTLQELLPAMLLLVVIAATLVVVNADVRGVQTANKDAYQLKETFRCLDGSMEIPFKFVNDEYCDCADGSDEPGTPACTLETQARADWRFQCTNIQFSTKEILHSHINDGVCDCCDGSDEYSSGTMCPNTCAEAFEKAEKERAAREVTRQAGLKAKSDLIAEAQAQRAEMKKRVDEESEKLKLLEQQLLTAELAKKDAEEVESRERAEIKQRSEEEYEKWKLEQQLKKAARDAELAANPPPQESSTIICSKWRQTKDCIGSGERVPSDDKDCDTTIPDGWSGYCDCFDSDSGSEVKFEFDCGHKALTCQFVCTHNGAEPDSLEQPKQEEEFKIDDGSKYESPTAVAARAEYQEKRRRQEEIERSIKEIESDLSKDFGPDDVFLPLKEKCFELEQREYTYKLCPFKEVQQIKKGGGHSPILGRWKGWGEQSYSVWGAKQDYTHMKFEEGEQCWGGPQRSINVHLVCGDVTRVSDVEEPSMCTYKLVFHTPAICE